MSPVQITALREALGLTKKDFAHLIGVSLRNAHDLEDPDYDRPYSRSVGLVMKLAQKALQGERVDGLGFLLTEAKKWGAEIEVQRPAMVE